MMLLNNAGFCARINSKAHISFGPMVVPVAHITVYIKSRSDVQCVVLAVL